VLWREEGSGREWEGVTGVIEVERGREGKGGEKWSAVVEEEERKEVRNAVDEDYRPKGSLTASVLVTKSYLGLAPFTRSPSHL